jgi:hypothetical protein
LATDPTSPVASYNVRYYVFPWNSPSSGAYRYPSNWQGTTSNSVSLVGTPGSEYCFEVRATSEAGAISAWTRGSCANLPLGQASLHSVASGQWSRHYTAGYYRNSYAETTIDGATLRLAGADANQVAVVATRCPSCGAVEVFVRGALLGSINTHGGRTQRSVMFVLPSFPNGRVTVLLEDVSRTGKVIIEGLGIG